MATNRYRVPEDQRRVKITVTIPRYLRDLLAKCANQSRVVEESLKKDLVVYGPFSDAEELISTLKE